MNKRTLLNTDSLRLRPAPCWAEVLNKWRSAWRRWRSAPDRRRWSAPRGKFPPEGSRSMASPPPPAGTTVSPSAERLSLKSPHLSIISPENSVAFENPGANTTISLGSATNSFFETKKQWGESVATRKTRPSKPNEGDATVFLGTSLCR